MGQSKRMARSDLVQKASRQYRRGSVGQMHWGGNDAVPIDQTAGSGYRFTRTCAPLAHLFSEVHAVEAIAWFGSRSFQQSGWRRAGPAGIQDSKQLIRKMYSNDT
ncbi:hypothetical protein BaRGS_00007216 [Batillaria attramentaria]|uniref:Uncharacterized protein n=1 Tax=Batillaria attramentaria TaxID=370345 RepID=A0ABD0LQ04_9CAEN